MTICRRVGCVTAWRYMALAALLARPRVTTGTGGTPAPPELLPANDYARS